MESENVDLIKLTVKDIASEELMTIIEFLHRDGGNLQSIINIPPDLFLNQWYYQDLQNICEYKSSGKSFKLIYKNNLELDFSNCNNYFKLYELINVNDLAFRNCISSLSICVNLYFGSSLYLV